MPNADQNSVIDPNADQKRSMSTNADQIVSLLRGILGNFQNFDWHWALIGGVLLSIFD